MRYLSHTPEDIDAMLDTVGVDRLDQLFSTIPENCRRERDIELPQMTEWELNRHMAELAGRMASADDYRVFLGAGSYAHHIPAAAQYVLSRSEFVTAYTPYQPEISQGTLQGIFEYQTLICRLLGMDVANASMYDGASALAEALLMTLRIQKKKNRVAVSALVHPHYRQVVDTYFKPTGFEVVTLPYRDDGTTDLSAIATLEGLAGVAVQSPNFFGCIEDLAAVGDQVRDSGALFVVGVTEPLAYGVFKTPGDFDADIACGEGQSLGIPQSFGGPGVGLFAAKKQFVRNMPGRLVGQTVDASGQRGFVLTLSTREQHIRREKATSNICSNQSLCAMATAVYMASLGGTGFRELARLNRDKAEYLKGRLRDSGFTVPFASPTFNEFVVDFGDGIDQQWRRLIDEKKIIAGLPIGCYYPELKNHYLLCVTEIHSREDLDLLVKEVHP
ncbi:MAG: aminomethyl-transferring glycine dehydrogenase subunit GcvPA [Desulfobacterales bacterium]|jgi:glycine dehydrogenase subunit 1